MITRREFKVTLVELHIHVKIFFDLGMETPDGQSRGFIYGRPVPEMVSRILAAGAGERIASAILETPLTTGKDAAILKDLSH